MIVLQKSWGNANLQRENTDFQDCYDSYDFDWGLKFSVSFFNH